MKDEMSIKKQRGKLSSQICDKTDRRKEGLYDPAHEHDACGVGMIVNLNGSKSHELVDSALRVLENMKHRGAEGAEYPTNSSCCKASRYPKKASMAQVSSSCPRTRRNRNTS